MADEVEIGPYVLAPDHRGVRVTRPANGPAGELRAHLILVLYEQGKQPVLFTIQRLIPQTGGEGLAIHGYTTDSLALDGSITYDEETEGLGLALTLQNTGEPVTLRLAVCLEFPGEADPEWLIPGLFYNENKVRDCQHVYPCYSEIHRDPAGFVSNHWSFRCDRAALPVVICQTYNVVGFVMTQEFASVSEQRLHGRGLTSIGFSTEDGFPVLRAEAPFCEEPVKFSFCSGTGTEMEEHFTLLEEGRPFEFNVQFGLIEQAEGVREELYRALYRQLWGIQPPRPKVSSIGAQHLAVEGLMQWHLDEANRMIHERACFDRHFALPGTQVELAHMHVGWQSGVLPAYVLLWHGRDVMNPNLVRAATSVLDNIASNVSPCGTLWPLLDLDEGPMAGAGPRDGLTHARTIGEALLFFVRVLRLELQANTSHPLWYGAIASSLNYAIQNQLDSGAFPAYWDAETGEVFSYDGCAGVCWIGALAACNHFFASNVYLEAACHAGEYYAEFIENGFLYGCVEDLPLAPTVDDCHMALIAYMMLYEADRSPRWLELARKAADLALTYRMAWNITFPPESLLGMTGFMTRGGDISSPAAPMLTANGLISYGEMQKLAALTGDSYYGERAREGRTFATQLLARVDGEFNARRGQGIGALFHTDWWQPKGMVTSLSYAWTLGLVAHAELIEMHMAIPHAALSGDSSSVMEAASRTSVVTLQKDLVMPESVEVRRRKEIAARQSRETDLSNVMVGERVQQLGPDFKYAQGEPDSAVGFPPSRPRISGAQFPVARKSKPAAARSGREPSSDRAFPFEPLKDKRRPPAAAASPPRMPSREFASDQTQELHRDRLPISGLMPPSPSSAEVRRPTPPPDAKPARPKAPLSSRHTPLSSDDIQKGIEVSHDDRPTHKLSPNASKPAPTPPGLSGEQRTSGLSALPPPPLDMAQGLLANLFAEDDRPRFTPINKLSDPSTGSMQRLQSPQEGGAASESSGDDPGSTPLPGAEREGDRGSTDEVKIKWKIF
ncbi:MAG: hypothetical protein PWP23_773 [Candidatus Sumerlaeota bacterium]|nr:hypothetical protein [Candidatus Sumerlaeota bacterium]